MTERTQTESKEELWSSERGRVKVWREEIEKECKKLSLSREGQKSQQTSKKKEKWFLRIRVRGSRWIESTFDCDFLRCQLEKQNYFMKIATDGRTVHSRENSVQMADAVEAIHPSRKVIAPVEIDRDNRVSSSIFYINPTFQLITPACHDFVLAPTTGVPASLAASAAFCLIYKPRIHQFSILEFNLETNPHNFSSFLLSFLEGIAWFFWSFCSC